MTESDVSAQLRIDFTCESAKSEVSSDALLRSQPVRRLTQPNSPDALLAHQISKLTIIRDSVTCCSLICGGQDQICAGVVATPRTSASSSTTTD